jgi:enoyl-CoA hydratase/carnithine racemase
MTEHTTPPVLVREEDDRAVRRVILDSPHNRNALSLALTEQLAAAFARIAADADDDRDDGVRAVVLTGTGPTFCAGADLKEDPSTVGKRSGLMVELLERMVSCPVPVVVHLNGNVRAGGLGLLGAADIVVAPDSATFAFSEVRVGVAPAIIAVTLLPKMTPRSAQRYFLTGETFDAAEAERCGLVTMAVPPEQVSGRVDRVLDAFRQAAPSALRITRKLLRDGAGVPANHETLGAAALLSAQVFVSDDAREGMQAFREKRAPRWVVS